MGGNSSSTPPNPPGPEHDTNRPTTPPPRPSNTPDTSAKICSVHSSGFETDTLEDRYDAILEGIRVVYEIDVNTFIHSLLPRLPDRINPKEISAAVKADISSDPWNIFPTDEAAKEVKEDEMFKALASLFDMSVKKAADVSGLSPTFAYVVKPNVALPVPKRNSYHEPDALIYVKDTEWKSSYYVALTWEFKKEGGDVPVNDVRSSPLTSYEA